MRYFFKVVNALLYDLRVTCIPYTVYGIRYTVKILSIERYKICYRILLLEYDFNLQFNINTFYSYQSIIENPNKKH